MIRGARPRAYRRESPKKHHRSIAEKPREAPRLFINAYFATESSYFPSQNGAL
jgi:hypothetical protein